MNRQKGIAEILSEISKIKNFEERQAALSTCANITPLIQVLHSAFHPDVKFALPSGAPPFKKLEKSVDAQGSFYRESKKLYLFIEGLSPNLHPLKREAMFVQLLEALDPDDADLLLAIKDKQMPYSGITYELVVKTFPGLLPEKQEESPKAQADSKRVACPFGCKSSAEDGLYSPGPLVMHIKKTHGESAEQKQTETN
jgi:hypothetical protein